MLSPMYIILFSAGICINGALTLCIGRVNFTGVDRQVSFPSPPVLALMEAERTVFKLKLRITYKKNSNTYRSDLMNENIDMQPINCSGVILMSGFNFLDICSAV